MKLTELTTDLIGLTKKKALIVPATKPRNPTHQTLAAKKNAAGPHRDKKAEMKKGLTKHKFKSCMHEELDTPIGEDK